MYEMYINGTIASYNEHSETRSHATILRVSSLIACSFGRWNNRKNSATKRDAAPLLLPSSFCMYKRRIFRARERVGHRYAAAAYRRINQNYYEAISAAATAREDKKAATPFDDQSFFKVHCFALDYYYYWEILDRGTRRNFGFREYQVRRTVGKHVYRVVTDELSLPPSPSPQALSPALSPSMSSSRAQPLQTYRAAQQ